MKFKAFNRDVDDFGDPDDISYVSDMMNDSISDDLGFEIFHFTLGLKRDKYKFVVYINNDDHVYSDHDNCWSNAQLAAMFFMGKWSHWFDETILPAMRYIANEARKNIEMSASKVVKEWRVKYNREVKEWKRKNMGHFLATFEGISTSRRSKSKRMIEIDGKSILSSKVFMSSKYRLRKYGWTKEMESEYRSAIRENWVKKTFSIVGAGSDDKDPLLQSIIANPYQHGIFIKSIGERALVECRDSFIAFMHGAKSPDIKPKTKQNRYRRKFGHAYTTNEWTVKGYTDKRGRKYPDHTIKLDREVDNWEDEKPPLYETGQLANAIESKVIKL